MADPRPLCLALVLLAGCSGPSTEDPLADASLDATSERDGLTPAANTPASAWQDGDWIAYDVAASRGWSGSVTATLSDGVFVADSRRWALEEATRDVPVLGEIHLATWATTAWGGPWDVLRLPLSDAATWQAKATLTDDYGTPGEVVLDLTARASDVPAPGGPAPGFLVEGRETDGGPLRLQAAWDPALGAPTQWRLLTPSGNESWSAVATSAGASWGGERWTATAHVLVEAYSLMAPTPESRPPVAATFDGAGAPWVVFGQLVAVAVIGTQEVAVVDPDGQTWRASAHGLASDVVEVDAPATQGDWRATSFGAGAVAFGGIFLWSVQATRD